MWQLAKYLLLVGLVALLCTELYFRAPFAPKILKYDFHPQRFYSLAPNQPKAHEMLANFSVLSPPYRINSDGFRGPEIKRGQPSVALVGSSEFLGEGVRESETIAHHLQQGLGGSILATSLGVVGYGPEHHELVFEWALENLTLEALVVRVSVRQRHFYLRDAADFPAEKLKKERNLKIRQLVNSAPFLFVKGIHQFNSPLHSFQRFLQRQKPIDPQKEQKIAAAAWKANADTWSAMLEAASGHGVPVLFLLENGTGVKSESLLCESLASITQPPMSAVVEVGPVQFGLDNIPSRAIAAEFKKRYTLGFDAHGNSDQYQLLAQQITRWWQGQRSNSCNEI